MISYILQFGNLNQQQIEFVSSRASEITLRQDEYFSEAGKVPRQIGFVMEGVFRFCYYNNKGEEITNAFVNEYSFVGDYSKFDTQMSASEYCQAVTKCRLIVFSRKDFEEISNTIIGWDKLVAKIFQKCLLETIDKRSSLVAEDATTRYLSFIDKFPNLANRVPLSQVASYLGITQQSLSRIRKNIR